MNLLRQKLQKLLSWIAGTIKVPVIQKREKKRGNGEKTQRELIKRWWN